MAEPGTVRQRDSQQEANSSQGANTGDSGRNSGERTEERQAEVKSVGSQTPQSFGSNLALGTELEQVPRTPSKSHQKRGAESQRTDSSVEECQSLTQPRTKRQCLDSQHGIWDSGTQSSNKDPVSRQEGTPSAPDAGAPLVISCKGELYSIKFFASATWEPQGLGVIPATNVVDSICEDSLRIEIRELYFTI